MIPLLVTLPGAPWDVLPPGVHQATLEEVRTAFATNTHRRSLFEGLIEAATRLKLAGCPTLYLDGSYVTGKPHPVDFDACWDPTGVVRSKLDSVFFDMRNGRAAQKKAFRGEFFPSSLMCADVGRSFLDFFQRERFTGSQKGIVSISLLTDPLLLGKV